MPRRPRGAGEATRECIGDRQEVFCPRSDRGHGDAAIVPSSPQIVGRGRFTAENAMRVLRPEGCPGALLPAQSLAALEAHRHNPLAQDDPRFLERAAPRRAAAPSQRPLHRFQAYTSRPSHQHHAIELISTDVPFLPIVPPTRSNAKRRKLMRQQTAHPNPTSDYSPDTP